MGFNVYKTALLCYHGNKKSDVVKIIPFLKDCYIQEKQYETIFIQIRYIMMFDPCRDLNP